MADGRDLTCPLPGCTSREFERPVIFNVRGSQIVEQPLGSVTVLRCVRCLCRFEFFDDGTIGVVWARGG